jgi:hypothetical protein
MEPGDAQLREEIDALITMIDTALRTRASHRLLHALACVLGDRRRRLAELGCIK